MRTTLPAWVQSAPLWYVSLAPQTHSPRPSNVMPMPTPTADWRPAKSDVTGLGQRALDWLDATVTIYRFDAVEGAHLLLALRRLGRLDQLEQTVSTAGVATDGVPHALLVAVAREARVFASLWAGLRLGRRDGSSA